MDAALPQMKVETEEDLARFAELVFAQMRIVNARMDERSERIDQALARAEERGKRIDELIHHVQMGR